MREKASPSGLVSRRLREASAQQTLESEARYRGLLEAAPDAMVVVDQLGEIVLLNVQAEKRFGYPRDELIGQRVTNIIPKGFAERLIADGLRSPEAALDQQIGAGIELTARRKDGSEFPIEIMLSPLESPEGILVTAAIRDITVRRAAEEHLWRTESRYRGLLEAAPDAMVVVDQEGEIVLLNVQAEKRFGYPRDELIGQKVTNIIPEGFAERLIADGLRSPEAALAQQIGTGIELSALRKDGSEFPIELMLSPLDSPDGILVTAAIRDISVRKAAEEQLLRTEAQYRGLLEAAPDAMVVVNQQGEIVLLNVQAEKRFGYPRDELIGQRVTNIIPEGFAERLIADGLRSPEAALAQQIGTGIELSALRKDGSEFPIELMLSPLDSPVGILVTAAIRDISVRKAAEEQLLRTEAQYRGLLEAAPDAMVVVNPSGEIVLLNVEAEKRFGYPRDELIGQKVTNIIPEGFAERLIADGLRSPEAALAQQIGTGIELSARRKDGSEFPIEIMLSPLESPEGILVTAAIRDITVRREYVDRLHASEQTAIHSADAMSAFLATMSHEIRTPLNGVLGMAQAMARGEMPEVQRERLGIIQTAGQSLLALLNDLLDLSKIQAGKIELEEGVIDAQDLADGALAFKALVEDKDVVFRLALEPSAIGAWRADPKRVRQILHNLVSNAVKFTDRGSVAVEIGHDGANLTMQVKDTGIGIPQDRLAHVYDRFVQADASMTRRYGGSGLGLAICRDLVTLMNGTIEVESVEGVGTTFTVALPLVRAEDTRPAEPEAEPPLLIATADGGLRVLAAEDNPMNQLVLKTLLGEVGVDVVMVGNGEEAVTAWRAEPWDIVLMDIQMPVMDGVSAIRLMRETERREGRVRTPVIALTANAMAHHRADYLAAGMDAVVAKPSAWPCCCRPWTTWPKRPRRPRRPASLASARRLAQRRHLLCGDVRRLGPEAGGDVVRYRGDLIVGIGVAEGGHVGEAVGRAPVGA